MSIHVVPKDDSAKHALALDCWCVPRVEYVDPDTGLPYPFGPVVVHASADGRETVEGTGDAMSGRVWETFIV